MSDAIRKTRCARVAAAFAAAATAAPVAADPPSIEDVRLEKSGMLWSMHVRIRHRDDGWGHRADEWEIRDPKGNLVFHRKLKHPAADLDPASGTFVRSATGLVFPDGADSVRVRVRDSLGGWPQQFHRVPLSPGAAEEGQ